jgi:hypothetical protein
MKKAVLFLSGVMLSCGGGCGDAEEVEASVASVYSFPDLVRRVHDPAKFRPATYSIKATVRKVSKVYKPAKYKPSHYSPSCSNFYCKSGYFLGLHYPGYPNFNCLGGIRQCIKDCKKGYFYAHAAHCVQECKSGCRYAANMVGDWRCRCCPKGTFYAHGYCYEGCGKGYEYLWYQPAWEWRCVATCPDGYSYFHKEWCVADCPKHYEYIYDEPLHKYDITAKRRWTCVRFVKRK